MPPGEWFVFYQQPYSYAVIGKWQTAIEEGLIHPDEHHHVTGGGNFL